MLQDGKRTPPGLTYTAHWAVFRSREYESENIGKNRKEFGNFKTKLLLYDVVLLIVVAGKCEVDAHSYC